MHSCLQIFSHLGTITLENGSADATGGHRVKSFSDGRLTVESSRLPFSPGPGDEANDDSIRAGLALVPFDTELNRFTLRSPEANEGTYRVTWGEDIHDYSAKQLRDGVNLAADFISHPLVAPFKKVMDAVAAVRSVAP